MRTERAALIDGWMEPAELEWLAFEASRHDSIVEIGSFLGRSTRALADNARGVVYAVDNWLGPKEIKPTTVEPSELWPRFQENLADKIDSGEVIPVKMDSLDAAGMFRRKGQMFDMVFIDASHDHESVRKDILAWAPLVKRGGLLCGHDSHWPGVLEARRTILPAHMVMWEQHGSLWACDNFQGLSGL